MEVEYTPEEYEAELRYVCDLIKMVHRRRIQKQRPMYFVEGIIRNHKLRLIKAAERNETLRARLARFGELRQLKAQEMKNKVKFRNKEEEEELTRRVEAEVLNTTIALRVSSKCISSASIKEEVNVKTETCE